MKKILEHTANIGAATARTIAFKIRSEHGYYYPNSSWRLPFFGGYKFETTAVEAATAAMETAAPPKPRRADTTSGASIPSAAVANNEIATLRNMCPGCRFDPRAPRQDALSCLVSWQFPLPIRLQGRPY